MAEYIEREAAIKEFSNNGSIFVYGKQQCKAIVSRLNTIPAADVRPVVLCRDCKNYIERSGACAYLVVGMREDDFCSYGKKREES